MKASLPCDRPISLIPATGLKHLLRRVLGLSIWRPAALLANSLIPATGLKHCVVVIKDRSPPRWESRSNSLIPATGLKPFTTFVALKRPDLARSNSLIPATGLKLTRFLWRTMQASDSTYLRSNSLIPATGLKLQPGDRVLILKQVDAIEQLNPGNGTETIRSTTRLEFLDLRHRSNSLIPATGLKHKEAHQLEAPGADQAIEQLNPGNGTETFQVLYGCPFEHLTRSNSLIPATGLKQLKIGCPPLKNLAIPIEQLNPGNGTETLRSKRCRLKQLSATSIEQLNPGNGTETSEGFLYPWIA